MEIIFDANAKKYIAKSSYAEKDIVKNAGFRWDRDRRLWWSADPQIVAKVERYLAPSAREAFAEAQATREAAIESSRAADAEVDIPHPDGMDYLPFQRAGIAFAMNRPATLIGDEMGLGKTIQALGTINADPSIQRVLIVSPLSVSLNWQREAEKWLVRPMSVGLATAQKWPDTAVVIAHWGIVAKHTSTLRATPWDMIVLDESHYAKNPKAARTKALFGDRASGVEPLAARRKLALSGTPIPNRPVELFPVARWLAPGEFGNWKTFVTRYCGACQSRWGWDVSGATHLDELQERLRSTVMVRRLKKDVLTELPGKTRQVVLIGADTSELKKALKAEREVEKTTTDAVAKAKAAVEVAKAGSEEDYQHAVENLRQSLRVGFTEISRVRHETALAKVPQVADHLKDLLRDSDRKVVVFAHHRDVVDQIREALETDDKDWSGVRTVVIVGGDTPEQRQEAVDAFQTDPNVRVFIGTIGAAKEGITLTAASIAVFAELEWAPSDMSQAEDRIHRIGQHDAVLIQHVLLDGSLDAKMAQTIIEKQKIIDQALDNQTAVAKEANGQVAGDGHESEADILAQAADQAAATHTTSREQIAQRAEHVTADDVTLVQTGLRQLAGMDTDFASTKNDMGFSKIDVAIGHDLAERETLSPKQAALGAKLLAKYHRQLEPEIAGIWKALGERKMEVSTKEPEVQAEPEDEYESGD